MGEVRTDKNGLRLIRQTEVIGENPTTRNEA